MSITNGGLYNYVAEREKVDSVKYPGVEEMFRQQTSTALIRSAAVRYPKFREGVLEVVRKVHGEVMERFKQLSLKSRAFQEGERATPAEVGAFFKCGVDLFGLGDAKIGDIKRSTLAQGDLKEFMDTHVIAREYSIQITRACWQRKLESLGQSTVARYPRRKWRTSTPPSGASSAARRR